VICDFLLGNRSWFLLLAALAQGCETTWCEMGEVQKSTVCDAMILVTAQQVFKTLELTKCEQNIRTAFLIDGRNP